MFRSYLRVAWRNLLRNKVFSFINITGLTLGMTAVSLIYLYVRTEHSYDSFYANSERIYRLPISYERGDVIERAGAGNHPALAPALKNNFPEIEVAARMSSSTINIPALTVSYEPEAGKTINFDEAKAFFGDAALLEIFDLPLIEGDKTTCLADPFSLLMTKRTAIRYFGNSPSVGKTVRLNGVAYTVTGVLRDLPPNTHLNFDLLASYPGRNFAADIWAWPEFLTYVRLAPGTDKHQLEAKFKSFLKPYFERQNKEYGYNTVVDLQPIEGIHLTSHLEDEIPGNGSASTVQFVGLLGIFIMLIAWINYINLSTAKSIDRAKEVGMRKVSGASRTQLVIQFISDAAILNFITVLLAAAFVVLWLPSFEQLTGTPIRKILFASKDYLRPSFWILPLAIPIAGAVVVGLYPSLLLSSFKPALVLKGKFTKSATGTMLRQGLVGFQYVVSILLIAATLTISEQITFMQEQDLGYNSDKMLIVKGPSNVDSTLASRFVEFKDLQSKLPEVVKMGRSTSVPGRQLMYANSLRLYGQGTAESVSAYNMTIDNNYFPTFEIPFAAGRNFTEDDRFSFPNVPAIASLIPSRDRTFYPNKNKIIINEVLSKNLGFKNPEDALNQRVRFSLWDEFTGEIIGVVKNFHQTSLKDNFQPALFFFGSYEQWPSISLRINTSDFPGTIAKIKSNFEASFPGNPFDYFFLNDYFNQQYKTEQQFKQVFSVLTSLAIVISCLGLVGLCIFSVSQRVKEIGIRKVLGAPVLSILTLFTRDSIKLVLISYVIALPFIWMGIRQWLDTFAFHVSLKWIVFIAPIVLLLVVSVVVIVVITLRAATTNPVSSLRSE